MSASASRPTEPTAEDVNRLQTEALTLAYLLGDLGVTLAVNLTTTRLFAEVSSKAAPGAADVLRLVTDRFNAEADFREDMISAVAETGHYLSDAPGFNSDMRVWPADQMVAALARVGLLVRHHYEAGDVRTPMLSSMPVPDKPVHANAHLLMRLVADRFATEPDFARDMTRVLIDAGRSQHQS